MTKITRTRAWLTVGNGTDNNCLLQSLEPGGGGGGGVGGGGENTISKNEGSLGEKPNFGSKLGGIG